MLRGLLVLVFFANAPMLAGQGARDTVSPGMSRAQVVSALGAPATERTVAEFRYLFYVNACASRCGMNDLVVLKGDRVVDAIFRSPSRRYTGTSSSPAPIAARDAADRAPEAGATRPTARPRTRMKPPAEANDVRPSIPANPPALQPAPSSQPARRTP